MNTVILDDVLVGSINQKQKGKVYVYPKIMLPIDPFRGFVGSKVKRVTIEFESLPLLSGGVIDDSLSLDPPLVVSDTTVMVPSGV